MVELDFSCSRCNVEKANKWPEAGLVDPCASSVTRRPEAYFDYDARTGELIPKGGLSDSDRRSALFSISVMGLNKWDILVRRTAWIREIQERLMRAPYSEWETIFELYTDSSSEYAGIARLFLAQYRQGSV